MSKTNRPLRLLHFADAHIDMINHGRHDPETGMPMRVVDFLSALDQIVDRAIAESVDLVIFAGDAYKDRNPQPTFQREWGRRIMRLSQAEIPTLLLVGNHDKSPATGRAHTMQEFDTFGIPHVHVADRLRFFSSAELKIPAQIISIPWVSRHALLTRADYQNKTTDELYTVIETRIADMVNKFIDEADPTLPLILTAHASVQGAVFGSERNVMLGQEVTLGGGLVNDKRLDYVALGHIHKHQDLSKGGQPPIVYSGSIERIDFGEIREKKGYVLADITRGHTDWRFETLKTRPFLNYAVDVTESDGFMAAIMNQLPKPETVKDAICRVQLSYPRALEPLLDEVAIAKRFNGAFSFQLAKQRSQEKRSRLGDTLDMASLTPAELLATYWETNNLEAEETAALQNLAREVLGNALDGVA